MWFGILHILNVVGTVTNSCIIAFTSYWGKSFKSITIQLLIVIGFEVIKPLYIHIQFFLLYINI